jgi:hypothetical protein
LYVKIAIRAEIMLRIRIHVVLLQKKVSASSSAADTIDNLIT